MRFRKVSAALIAIAAMVLPARADEQASIVAPLAGPMNMATMNANYINPAFRALATCSWGPTAPANGPSSAALPQQCWWDTSGTPYVLKWYVGSSWVAVANINASTHAFTLPGHIIGTNVQAYNANLAAIAAATTAANKLGYWTGSATYALTDFTSFARTLLDDADAAAMRTTLGLVIGTNVQAYNANLAALAGLTGAAGKVPYFTGPAALAMFDSTSFGRSLSNAADASALRTLAGVEISALPTKASPVSADTVIIGDSAAGGALKQATLGTLPGGGGGGGSTTLQEPGGRLTLESGVAVMKADQIASQNLYYAPDRNSTVPVRVSGSWANQSIATSPTDQVGLTLALAGSSNWAPDSIHDVFLIVDGGVPKLATRLWDSGMYETETQIANATLVTTGTGANGWSRASAAFDGVLVQPLASAARIPPPSNDGLFNTLGQDWGSGNAKVLSKAVITAASDNNLQGGASPALTVLLEGSNNGSTWYRLSFHYLDATASATTYTLPVNEYYDTPYRYHRVNIQGDATAGGGTGYSINVAEVQFFEKNAPANGRRLTKYDGLWVNDANMTVRTGASTTVSVAQYEATYLGSIQIDPGSAGQVTAHVKSGPSRLYGVYNAYNQRPLALRAWVPLPGVSNYALSAVRWTPIQGTTSFSARFLKGLPDGESSATLARNVYINAQTMGGVYSAGIGINTTAIFSGQEMAFVIDTTGQAAGMTGQAKAILQPFAGSRTLYGIEKKDTRTGPVSPGADARSGSLEVGWKG